MESSSILHTSEEIDSFPQILHPSNTVFSGNIALNLVKQNRYLLLNIYSCSNLLLQLEAEKFKGAFKLSYWNKLKLLKCSWNTKLVSVVPNLTTA